MRKSYGSCGFGSVIGVSDGYIEWRPGDAPPTEQERLGDPGLERIVAAVYSTHRRTSHVARRRSVACAIPPMGIFSRIKSLFRRQSSSGGVVPFFDVPSGRVVHIPAKELRPGCVQARVEGVQGTVWVLPEQLHEGPIRHPPLDDELRSYVRDIQAAFAEHRDLSVEEWEEGFRRDADPVREIAGFSYAADVYRLFTKAEKDATRRADIYHLLIACMTTSPDSVWHVVKLNGLTRAEAEQIVRRFYGGEKAGDAATP